MNDDPVTSEPDTSEPDDPPLAHLLAEGEECWNKAWDIAFPKLYAIACRNIQKHDFDDGLVNELFMRSLINLRESLEIHRSSSEATAESSSRTFQDVRKIFVKICRDTTIDYFRKHGKESPYEDQLKHEGTEDEQILDDLQWDATFNEVLQTLRPIYRELLIGKYIKEQTTSELAKLHNLKEGTVSAFLSRAKDELRDAILRNPKYAEILTPESLTAFGGK